MIVTLYSLSTCPFSQAEEQFLQKNSISYNKVLLDQDPTKLAEFRSVNGGFYGVPFTIIAGDDGKSVSVKGFNEQELLTALHIQQTRNDASLPPQGVDANTAGGQPTTPLVQPTQETQANAVNVAGVQPASPAQFMGQQIAQPSIENPQQVQYGQGNPQFPMGQNSNPYVQQPVNTGEWVQQPPMVMQPGDASQVQGPAIIMPPDQMAQQNQSVQGYGWGSYVPQGMDVQQQASQGVQGNLVQQTPNAPLMTVVPMGQ